MKTSMAMTMKVMWSRNNNLADAPSRKFSAFIPLDLSWSLEDYQFYSIAFYCLSNISLHSTNPTYVSFSFLTLLTKDHVFWHLFVSKFVKRLSILTQICHQFAKISSTLTPISKFIVQVFGHQPNLPKDQAFWHQFVIKFAKRSIILTPISQILKSGT